MKAVIAVLLIGIVWAQDHLRTCPIKCLPDDEFVANETTAEWDQFMEKITSETFKISTLKCVQNESQSVQIDYHSDLIWDLRFRLYSQRENLETTLNDCYCDFEDCKSDQFRECLKNARIAMYDKVTSVITATIQETLFELTEEC